MLRDAQLNVLRTAAEFHEAEAGRLRAVVSAAEVAMRGEELLAAVRAGQSDPIVAAEHAIQTALASVKGGA